MMSMKRTGALALILSLIAACSSSTGGQDAMRAREGGTDQRVADGPGKDAPFPPTDGPAPDAKPPVSSWAVSTGGSGTASATSVGVDSTGNVYVAGRFSDTVAFGPKTATAKGIYDAYVAKLDPAGKFLWVTPMGGTQHETVTGLAMAPGGGVLVSGQFQGAMTAGSITLLSKGSSYGDAFAARIDSAGTVKWAVNAGGISSDCANAITADSAGNSYITGWFRDVATFGSKTITAVGQYDHMFLARLDPGGTFLAAEAHGAGGEGLAVAFDAQNDLFLAGTFYDTATFGTKSVMAAGGGPSIYVAKRGAGGGYQWVATVDGAANYPRMDLAPDAAGGAFVVGSFVGSAKIGATTLTAKGLEDIFVARLGPGGQFQWAFGGGGPGTSTTSDLAFGVALDKAGRVHVTGSFAASATFGTHSFTAVGGQWDEDLFVLELDGAGTLLSAVAAGSAGGDSGNDVVFDAAGSRYLVGEYYKAITIDGHALSAPEGAGFIWKRGAQ